MKLDLHDDRDKQKAMRSISGISGIINHAFCFCFFLFSACHTEIEGEYVVVGIDSIAMDMKERKMTVIGNVDPVEVAVKLKKKWHTEILTVGPAKEPEKKKEEQSAKKDEPKKEEGGKKGDQDKKKKEEEDHIARLVRASIMDYNSHFPGHYHAVSVEENPNSCVIS